MNDKPTILGGKKTFEKDIPPVLPSFSKYTNQEFLNKIESILKSNQVTNGEYVKELEEEIKNYIGVNNTVLLSSCTSGLILSLAALSLRDKEVILPSFTNIATGNAAYWNNCKLVFADVDRETFNISIEDIKNKISKNTAAILAVNMYGNPGDIKELEKLAQEHNMKLIFDSAQALGSSYKGKKIGNFGDVEVFSGSPTKHFSTMEGGFVVTDNDELASLVRVARNYGSLPNYDAKILGLSARMPEINAAAGLLTFKHLDLFVKNRQHYVELYQKLLKKIGGFSFQKVNDDCVSTHHSYGVLINEDEFGLNNFELAEALKLEGVLTKIYYHPPIHKLTAYAQYANLDLPNTDYISTHVICPPLYESMDEELVIKICETIEKIKSHSKEIKKVLNKN